MRDAPKDTSRSVREDEDPAKVTEESTESRRIAALVMRDGVPDTARLRGLLSDVDWRVRKQAAETATAHLADVRVTAVLVEALLQPDEVGLRNAAVEAFARADARDAARVARALLPTLGGQAEGAPRASRTARKFVAAALVGAAEAAIEPLATLAADADVMTASSAIESLASLARRGIAGRAVEELLASTLTRSEPVLQLAAIDGLVACGAVVEARALRGVLADPITSPSAVRLLARARGEDAIELLLTTLGRKRSTVDAALALAHRSDPERPEPERALVSARDRERLGAASRALGAEVIAELARALSARPPDDARALARLFLDAGELRLLTAIVELGARAELDPATRTSLVALGARAIEPLLAIVRERALDDARVAAWALGAASDLAAIERSISSSLTAELTAAGRALLAQGEEVGARAAAAVLGRWGDPVDAAALAARVGAHGSAYEAVAAAAVEAIAQRAPEEVRSLLPERVGRHARTGTVSAAALDDLRSILASDDAARRAAAIDALAALDSPDRVELVAMALTDEDERVQLSALGALARARGVQAADEAVRSSRVAMGSDLPNVRAEAIRTLGQLGAFDEPEHAAELLRRLADPSPRVVIVALRAIEAAALRGPAVDNALDAVLLHGDPEVVKEALHAIDRGADEAALARARRGLTHEHWSVRVRAAEVLGRAAPTLAAARAALAAQRLVERDELVLRAITAGLSTEAPRGAR